MQKFFQNQQLIGRWWAEICELSWPLAASISHQLLLYKFCLFFFRWKGKAGPCYFILAIKNVLVIVIVWPNYLNTQDLFWIVSRNILPGQGRLSWTSLVLPTMWETWVWSLGQEDPLQKEMATHSSTLAWKISWMEEPGRLQSMGSQRIRHD